MKLYYSPDACSLSPHIVLRELGIPFAAIRVNLASKRTEDGLNLHALNPKGAVPALRLDSGEVLTEGAAIVQFLADQVPENTLMPPVGTLARARVQEALNYIAAELHKAFSPLFSKAASAEVRAAARTNVEAKLGAVEAMLADGRDYIAGGDFSPADAYLFTVVRWAPMVGIALDAWPALQAHHARIAARPATVAALAAEAA
jgi:glutathione S-transferase